MNGQLEQKTRTKKVSAISWIQKWKLLKHFDAEPLLARDGWMNSLFSCVCCRSLQPIGKWEVSFCVKCNAPDSFQLQFKFKIMSSLYFYVIFIISNFCTYATQYMHICGTLSRGCWQRTQSAINFKHNYSTILLSFQRNFQSDGMHINNSFMPLGTSQAIHHSFPID